MSHWQLECILRAREKMTHLLISQGDGSMGQDDEHWKQCRDWGRWSPYVQGLAAPSCTKTPDRSRWRLALTTRNETPRETAGKQSNPATAPLATVGKGAWNVSLWRCEECLEPTALCSCHRGSITSPSLHLAPCSSQASKGEYKSLI